MTRTIEATLVRPAPRPARGTAPRPARRDAVALVESTLRLFMWTTVAVFTLLLVVVIALG